MKLNNKETLRIRLYSYYEKYKNLGKRFTIDYFISKGEKRTTIYDKIIRFETVKNAKHRSGGGRPAKIFKKQAKKKLKRLVNNKDGVSHENSLVKNTRNKRFQTEGSTKGSQKSEVCNALP